MPKDRKSELADATHIFTAVWDKLEAIHGRAQLRFPKEIMWLGGAPGAGKGTNTPFIMRERGMTSEPIVMSSLLNSPIAERLKKDGYLVGDREAVGLLLEELLKEEYESGVVVDGFPRTKVQVDVVRMLFQRMQELRAEFFNQPIGPRFRQPIFRITILHVRESVSIERQLSRGKFVQAHNAEVEKTGEGELLDLRNTDLDPEMAKRRYRVFMEHTFEALTSLRDSFHYHLIGANGDISSVELKINKGFQYQSSLELGSGTFDSIHDIPVVDLLTLHTRQQLVKRLDNYHDRHSKLFASCIAIILEKFVPIMRRQAAVGRAKIRCNDLELNQDLAVDMIIDILVERGYSPTAELKEEVVPLRVDPETHAIINATSKIWLFEIVFPSSRIRRGH